jgi:hypothetical protein
MLIRAAGHAFGGSNSVRFRPEADTGGDLGDWCLTWRRDLAQGIGMTPAALWLKFRYARLLISAKERVASGDYAAARADAERIFALHAARGAQVPIPAEVMAALVAWNQGRYDDTARSVRRAGDGLAARLAAETRPERRHELHYLRAYCWTLLWYAQARGATVRWDDFADLAAPCEVALPRVSQLTREMFPVDEQVFTTARPQASGSRLAPE